jgi:polysaccharide biosynthesis protein PslG
MVKKIAAAAAVAVVVLLVGLTATAGARTRPAHAVPPINYGVADNMSFFADDGGAWFYGELAGAGLTENRWEMRWDASSPTAITQLAFLQRAAPKAQAAGVHVVLVLDSKHASDHDPAAFCAWAATVASTAKQWGIHDFVVWNEPNTSLYWAPQNSSSPAAYEALLATCYDAIHAADPEARVVGFGLSPRSNGRSQTAPIPFIAAVAAAYRASRRAAPIMDQMSVHPYPNPSSPTDAPDVGYTVTSNYGVPNLDRVKQALYDGFNGTGQPTTLNGLTFRIDELGWQTATTQYTQYYNQENVKVISEQTQAAYIEEAVQRYFACDPSVTDVDWFLLVDEATRNGRSQDGTTVLGGGWQSGLLTAGGQGLSTPKAAYSQVGALFAAGRGACTAGMTTWTATKSSGTTAISTGKSAKSKLPRLAQAARGSEEAEAAAGALHRA